MTLIDAHLEQISLSAVAISELPFPSPKIFTNALLHKHDITALIRDTEAHERALFSVPPAPTLASQDTTAANASRRKTTYNISSVESGTGATSNIRAPRRNTAVAAVLGGDLVEQIRRGGGGGPGTGLGYAGLEPRERGEVDVEVLLKGAEKLCAVYPIAGAPEQIASLRSRHAQLSSSLSHHEARVTRQEGRLEKKNRPLQSDDEGDEADSSMPTEEEELEITEDDLRREEEEIKELEQKKRALEERVAGMERDLGGLLR